VAKAKTGKKIKIKVERSSKNMMDPLFAEEWASLEPESCSPPKKDLFFLFLCTQKPALVVAGSSSFLLDD
jgi:hypothetical protein